MPVNFRIVSQELFIDDGINLIREAVRFVATNMLALMGINLTQTEEEMAQLTDPTSTHEPANRWEEYY